MPILVLDLGGVLVRLDDARLRPVLRPELGPRAWADWLLAAEAPRLFDTGRLSPEAFFEAAAIAVGIPGLSPSEFGAAFFDWVDGWLPGAEALIQQLRTHAFVACLSNSNAAHWPKLQAMGLPGCFDATLLSWQLGVAKPDPAIWRLAEGRLGAKASDIVFVDDNPINLESARRAGWRALHARGPDEAARVLSSRME